MLDQATPTGHCVSTMRAFTKAWRWLWSRTRRDEEQWSAGAFHCPRCGQELPAFRPGNMNSRLPVWLGVPTDGDLVRVCPFDGHAPFNDKAREMLDAGTLPLTRRTDAP